MFGHHEEPRVKLYVSRGMTSYSTEIRRRDQGTSTSLDVMLERSIDGYWNVDGGPRNVRYVDRFH